MQAKAPASSWEDGMLHLRRVIVCASVALAEIAIRAAPAAAQSVAEFYTGKTISILMGTQPGGSYDLYGRVIGEHLSRYIPGNPTIIMEHMPGAGGVVAGNHLYGPGPQDGTKILLSHSIPLAERLEPKGVRFESTKIQWLGTFDAIAHTMAIWHSAQVNTIDVLKTKPLVIGSFAKGHLTYQWPAMMKHVLGTSYQVITGYRSGSDLNLAMERGEIDGWAASWENRPAPGRSGSPRRKFRCWCRSHLSARGNPGRADPARADAARQEGHRGVPHRRNAVRAGHGGGPGVPADRVAALRKAFDDVMKDPAFLAEAAKRKLDIDPRPAAYPTRLPTNSPPPRPSWWRG